jgi:hypothetical protein
MDKQFIKVSSGGSVFGAVTYEGIVKMLGMEAVMEHATQFGPVKVASVLGHRINFTNAASFVHGLAAAGLVKVVSEKGVRKI